MQTEFDDPTDYIPFPHTPDWEDPDESAEYRQTHIGDIDQGIDGRDQYVRLSRLDDDLDLDSAHNWLRERYYHRTGRIGGYFCTSVTIVPLPHNNSECIGIIHHRYDV